jgi:DNA-binding MarR family transcriptional regulator
MSGKNHTDTNPPMLSLLLRGARWFSDELLRRLAEAGVEPITPAHAAVLAHLDARTALSIAELARRAGVSRQTMHRAVTQLVNEGLLASTPAPGFPRSSLIELTIAGSQRRDIASGILRDLEEDLAEQLGDTEFAHLRESLKRAWSR